MPKSLILVYFPVFFCLCSSFGKGFGVHDLFGAQRGFVFLYGGAGDYNPLLLAEHPSEQSLHVLFVNREAFVSCVQRSAIELLI